MAVGHALSGAAAGLAVAHGTGVDGWGAVLLGGAWAGAALLPDLDHPGATATRAGGVASRVAGAVLGAVSGGHRGGTHSLLGVLAAGTAAAGLVVWVPWGVAAVAVVLVLPVLLVADRVVPGPHAVAVAVTVLVAVGAGSGAGAVAEGLGVGWWQWPAAVAGGMLVHLVGDQITRSGIRWGWPVQGRPSRLPVAIRAGGVVERVVVAPLLVGVVAWLMWATV